MQLVSLHTTTALLMYKPVSNRQRSNALEVIFTQDGLHSFIRFQIDTACCLKMYARMSKERACDLHPLTSSKIRIFVFRKSARAKHTSCLCPELRLDPASLISASRPPGNFSDTNSLR